MAILGRVAEDSPPAPNADPGTSTESVEAKRERTRDEIQRLVAEHHLRLPRQAATETGAVYARYSSRFQDSIADQVRTLLDEATRRGIFVPFEHVFFDAGVRGYKSDRDGLNGLRDCIRAKAIKVALFFATNRLFRKVYRSLQFVEEQLVERGVRAIFVKSGIDTADARRWRGLLSMNAVMDEFVVSMNVENIRAAHEGLLERRLVFGTVTFGYRGEPVPGEKTRRGWPRRTLSIDPVAGDWVRKIFRWYVTDRVTVLEIVRRLKADPTAPPPAKARVWSRPAVWRILRNSRYRGVWRYGSTESVWVSSKDYARQVERDKPLKVIVVEELRLVSDEVWHAAARLMAKEAARVVGRKPRDGDAVGRTRALNGLFVCPTHDRKLYVGGPGGKSMFCKDCQATPAAERPLFSLLPRGLALEMTCAAVADRIRDRADLVPRVVAACRRYAAEGQAPDPRALEALLTRRQKLDRSIDFVLRNPGESETDRAESETELRRLRRERAAADAERAALEAARSRAVAVPSEEEVVRLLDRMESILASAARADRAGEGRVRELIDLVTGGRIELTQMGERSARRGWLRGRFRATVLGAIAGQLTGCPLVEGDDAGEEVVIDYRRPAPETPAELVRQVVGAFEAGELIKEIARRLNLPRSRVSRILDEWDARRGLEREDGRSRRSGLALKHVDAPLYQSVADEVKRLADEGRLLGDIATRLSVDRNTVTSAWRHWHVSRGLPVPDGRTRRKSLPRKTGSREEKVGE